MYAYKRVEHSLQPHPVIRSPSAAVESASAVCFGIVVGGRGECPSLITDATVSLLLRAPLKCVAKRIKARGS